MNYAMPELTPNCRCKDAGPGAGVFCPTGHMLECHYPLDCRNAGCSHLARYDYAKDEVDAFVAADGENLGRLAAADCLRCQGTGLHELRIPMAEHPLQSVRDLFSLSGNLPDDASFSYDLLCGCVVAVLVGGKGTS